jgi:hypothetical protein
MVEIINTPKPQNARQWIAYFRKILRDGGISLVPQDAVGERGDTGIAAAMGMLLNAIERVLNEGLRKGMSEEEWRRTNQVISCALELAVFYHEWTWEDNRTAILGHEKSVVEGREQGQKTREKNQNRDERIRAIDEDEKRKNTHKWKKDRCVAVAERLRTATGEKLGWKRIAQIVDNPK